MSKLKAPAYQWYPRDYIASTRVTMMSLAEEAIYRRLLDYCWLEGSISADPHRVQRLIGKGATIDEIKEALVMFETHPEDDAKLIHPRLDMQRKERESNSKKKAEAANIRWGKVQSKCNAHAYAPALQMVCPTTTTTPTTTSTTTPTTNTTTNNKSAIADDIEKVWKAYPNKKGKKNAIKGITKALKTYTLEDLIKRIDDYSKSTDPRYHKHGSTYFNGEHYDDEYQPVKAYEEPAAHLSWSNKP